MQPPTIPTLTSTQSRFVLLVSSICTTEHLTYKYTLIVLAIPNNTFLIGVGSSSKVYLVRSVSSELHTIPEDGPLEDVYSALKVINKEESAPTSEDEILTQLNHPLIVQPYVFALFTSSFIPLRHHPTHPHPHHLPYTLLIVAFVD